MRAMWILVLLPLLPLGAQGKGKKPAPKAPAVTEAPAPKPIRWDGEWALVEADSTDLATAIPEHVKALNFVMKPLWKHKLEKACSRDATLSLISGGNVTITFGKEIPVTLQGDGSASTWKRSEKESYQVRMAKEGATLTLTFEGDGYILRRELEMDGEGDSLTLRTTYVNPKCPAGDFAYKAVYKRK